MRIHQVNWTSSYAANRAIRRLKYYAQQMWPDLIDANEHEEGGAQYLRFYFPDASVITVDDVDTWLAAYDNGTLIPDEADEAAGDVGRQDMTAIYNNTVTMFEDALDTWDTLTQAELQALLKRSIRVNLALLKTLKRQLTQG